MTTARRQRLGAEARRAQIMAAAVVVIAARGYGGASVELIARQAGVSKGLLWHYFADRDDLVEQVAREALVTLRRAVGATLDLDAPAGEVIRAAVHGAARVITTHPAERRALQDIIANLRTPEGVPRLTLQDYESTYASQQEIIARGQREGDLRADLDPRLVAVTYQGAVDAMLGYLEAHPDTDPERYADLVADILLQGIARTDRGGVAAADRREVGSARP